MNGQKPIRSDTMQKRILAFFVGVLFVMQMALPIYADDVIGDVSESGEVVSADLYTDSGNEQIDNSVDLYSDEYSISEMSAVKNFTDISGSYTTDISKPYDGNWHILSWGDGKKPDDNNWDYNGNHFMQSDPAYEYITGGIPAGSAITKFSIDVTTYISNKKYVDIYVSDSLDGNWIKCDYTTEANVTNNSQNKDMKSGNLRYKITFNFEKNHGYRYVKVSKNIVSSDSGWQWLLGGFSFEWDDIFSLQENEIRVKIDDDNYTDYIADLSDNLKKMSDGSYGSCLGLNVSADNAYVIYSAPEGKCFKYFYVDIANGDNSNIMSAYNIGTSSKKNGKYLPADISEASAVLVPGTTDNMTRFTFPDISSPFIKISFAPGSNYEYFKLGTFGFELSDYIEVNDDELITFKADTKSGNLKDWGILSAAPGGLGLANWTNYISTNQGEHYFLQGSDGTEYDVYIGGIGAGMGIREFTVESFMGNNRFKVYASDKIDGNYVEIPKSCIVTQPYLWKDGSVTKHYFRMRAAEGYRYIKLYYNSRDWQSGLGQITYTYGSINGPELYKFDSGFSGGNATITVTPMLEMFEESKVTFLMTAYKNGKLIYVSKKNADIGNSSIIIDFSGVPVGNDVEYQLCMLRYSGDKIEFVIPPSSLEE